jgi:predicted lipid-binding transport protein (Tim44 family)
MAARRTKKEIKKPAPNPTEQAQEEQAPPPSMISQVFGLLLQMAMMWVMSSLIMYALKYYGVAQGAEL